MLTATIDRPATFAPRQQPYSINGDKLELRFHRHQWRAWDSVKRFVVVLAGTQGGKTSFGPFWLKREIKERGPGDYLVVAPTYPLLSKKTLPEFRRLFETLLQLGTYGAAAKTFILSPAGEIAIWGKRQKEQTKIFFGHAQDPDSLESATAKAAWLDECGQKKFKLTSFEAIMRRLSIHIGRVLMTTTPYYIGWLKKQFWDVWKDAAGKHPEIDVIRFRSVDNPAFPKSEYERARRILPKWKFDMYYNALFTKAAGLIYNCFNDNKHVLQPFAIPENWPRYLGLDFGGVNTAAVYIAKDPASESLYVYNDYYPRTTRAAEAHAAHILDTESRGFNACYGGAKSEGQWRLEFGKGGLPVGVPLVSDVEVGINRVYSAIKNDRLWIFNTCNRLLDEMGSYSRPLDENGQPMDGIEDKSHYHMLDALRYIMSYLVNDSWLVW